MTAVLIVSGWLVAAWFAWSAYYWCGMAVKADRMASEWQHRCVALASAQEKTPPVAPQPRVWVVPRGLTVN